MSSFGDMFVHEGGELDVLRRQTERTEVVTVPVQHCPMFARSVAVVRVALDGGR